MKNDRKKRQRAEQTEGENNGSHQDERINNRD